MNYLVPDNAVGVTLRLYYEDVHSQACGNKPRALPRLIAKCQRMQDQEVELEIGRINAYDFLCEGTPFPEPIAVILDTTGDNGQQQHFYWYDTSSEEAKRWVEGKTRDQACIRIVQLTLVAGQ